MGTDNLLDDLCCTDGAIGVEIQQFVQIAQEGFRFGEFLGEPGGLSFKSGEVNGGHKELAVSG